MGDYALLRVRNGEGFRLIFFIMKIVPFEGQREQDGSAPIPEVSENLYGELFFAADWAVLNRPWEAGEGDVLFELTEEGGAEVWQAFLSEENGLCCFALVRGTRAEKDECGHRLEVRFIASDFLQGHDYDLNVRFAPDAWDECERDVIVMRSFDGAGAFLPLDAQEVKLLTEGLCQLRTHMEGL